MEHLIAEVEDTDKGHSQNEYYGNYVNQLFSSHSNLFLFLNR